MATSGISDPSSGGANWHNMSPGDGVQTQSLDETSATNGLGNTAGADGKNLDDVAPVKSPKGNAGLLADANGAPRIDGLTVSFSEDDMVLALAALQMDPAGMPAALERLVDEGAIQVEGDRAGVVRLLGMLEVFDPMFHVVEP